MTDQGKWHIVAGSRFGIRIAHDGEIIDAMQLRTHQVRASEIDLAVTTGVQRLEGNVFHCGARGIAYIAGAICAGLAKPNGARLNSKMASLFAGDPIYADMLAATCRAMQGHVADGEAGYFLSCAEEQLAERAWVPLVAQVSWVDTGLPLGLSRAR